MKRILTIGVLAFFATACIPERSRVILLECINEKEEPTTIQQIRKATADEPDRVKRMLTDESYSEDYEEGTYYPFAWLIDKKLGIDYVYSEFDRALIPYKDPAPTKESDGRIYHTSVKTSISEDKKIYTSQFKEWYNSPRVGDHGHTLTIERLHLENLTMEINPEVGEKSVVQCIEHNIPESITINFPDKKSGNSLKIPFFSILNQIAQ